MRTDGSSLFLALLCLLFPGGGLQSGDAQELSAEKPYNYSASSAPEPERSEILISKRVDEVNLIFTVTDRHGRFVEKLPAGAFHVRDNHRDAGPLTYFQQQSNLPLRVALLIDLSDSIRDRFEFEKKAAAVFF